MARCLVRRGHCPRRLVRRLRRDRGSRQRQRRRVHAANRRLARRAPGRRNPRQSLARRKVGRDAAGNRLEARAASSGRGRARPLPDFGIRPRTAQFLPDGKRLLLSGTRGNEPIKLYIADVEPENCASSTRGLSARPAPCRRMENRSSPSARTIGPSCIRSTAANRGRSRPTPPATGRRVGAGTDASSTFFRPSAFRRRSGRSISQPGSARSGARSIRRRHRAPRPSSISSFRRTKAATLTTTRASNPNSSSSKVWRPGDSVSRLQARPLRDPRPDRRRRDG